VAKQEPDEQYTPRGKKIPIPERPEFERNLDRLLRMPPSKKVLGRRSKGSPSEGSSGATSTS
jgi:hypothetical protein